MNETNSLTTINPYLKPENNSIDGSITQKMSSNYSDQYGLRAMVQAIPGIGSSIDMVLSGPGINWRMGRIEEYIQYLNTELNILKNIKPNIDLAKSEEFYDFFVSSVEKVAKTRSKEKIARFAQIATNQVLNAKPWDEAEDILRLVDSLDDFQVMLLKKVEGASECSGSFEGIKAVAIRIKDSVPEEMLVLANEFNEVSERRILLACSDLLSKGLLSDEGIGRVGSKAMEYFIINDIGLWFLSWLRDFRKIDASLS